jgi:hypothetical protein
MVAAFYITVVSSCTERRERSPLVLASAGESGHAATLAESRKTVSCLHRGADLEELLRMNEDAPREHSFQFRPFTFDALVPTELARLPKELARKRSE